MFTSKTHLIVATIAIVYAIGIYHAFSPTYSSPQSSILKSTTTLFSKWNTKYGITHDTPSEFFYRLGVFASTHKEILTLRDKFKKTKFGHNLFSAMTKLEKKNTLHGSLTRDESEKPEGEVFSGNNLKSGNLNIPKSYSVPNQRPVKHQQKCGCCWAFACKHMIQDLLGNAEEVSPQYAINCENKKSHGCQGGFPDYCLEMTTYGGFKTEEECPYQAKNEQCLDNPYSKVQSNDNVKKYQKLSNEDQPKEIIIGNKGLGTTIVMNAENQALYHYQGGVFETNSSECKTENQNHAVHLIGWDSSSEMPYWIIRNSWGEGWGVKGFLHIQINKKFSEPGLCFCGGKLNSFNCYAAWLTADQ